MTAAPVPFRKWLPSTLTLASYASALTLTSLACTPDAGSSGDSIVATDDAIRVWPVGQQPSAVLQAGTSVYIAHGLFPHGGLYGGSDPIGWVGRYGPDGDLLDTLAKGLYLPSALAADSSVLHVLHGRGVVSYALPDGEVVARLTTGAPESTFRALSAAPQGTVFVADTAGYVRRADPRIGFWSAVPICRLPGIAALAFDQRASTLYLATSNTNTSPGRLWAIGPSDESPRLLGSVRADFTSLIVRGGVLYASTFNVSPLDLFRATGEGVYAIDAGGAFLPAIPHADSVVAPGQVEVLGGDLLFVPEPHSGRVVIIRLPTPKL